MDFSIHRVFVDEDRNEKGFINFKVSQTTKAFGRESSDWWVCDYELVLDETRITGRSESCDAFQALIQCVIGAKIGSQELSCNHLKWLAGSFPGDLGLPNIYFEVFDAEIEKKVCKLITREVRKKIRDRTKGDK